jgi:hypothetical protein
MPSRPALRPLAEILETDGTLKPDAPRGQSFDVRGWRMVTDVAIWDGTRW